jgi:hypothetical protein
MVSHLKFLETAARTRFPQEIVHRSAGGTIVSPTTSPKR